MFYVFYAFYVLIYFPSSGPMLKVRWAPSEMSLMLQGVAGMQCHLDLVLKTNKNQVCPRFFACCIVRFLLLLCFFVCQYLSLSVCLTCDIEILRIYCKHINHQRDISNSVLLISVLLGAKNTAPRPIQLASYWFSVHAYLGLLHFKAKSQMTSMSSPF